MESILSKCDVDSGGLRGPARHGAHLTLPAEEAQMPRGHSSEYALALIRAHQKQLPTTLDR